MCFHGYKKSKALILQLYERLSNLRNEVGDSKLTARTQRLLMLGEKLLIVADWPKVQPNNS
jgi:hypothetical protein